MKFLVSVLALAAVSTFNTFAVAQSTSETLVAENNPETFANTQANEEEKTYEATIAKDQVSSLMKRTARSGSATALKNKEPRTVASMVKQAGK